MIYPQFINKGDCIGIPAPSAGAGDSKKEAKFKNAIKKFEELGYKLVPSNNLYKCEKGRSANAKERASEINEMFKDNNINMILCATGGDFLLEILPYINFDLIKENPKMTAGFSDPTGILYSVTTKCDIATIYGQNFSSFGAELLHRCHEDFLKIINGNLIQQHSYDLYENEYQEKITGLEGYNLTEKVYWKTLDNNEVSVRGRIIGGCFDIISDLAGTKYDGAKDFIEKYKEDGMIWYFDNCEISMEETIRILWKFNEMGYFEHTKAIIFGRFGVDTTFYDYDVESCLKDSAISKLNIPIIYNADISHKSPCMTIINGSIANVHVKDGRGEISFELK